MWAPKGREGINPSPTKCEKKNLENLLRTTVILCCQKFPPDRNMCQEVTPDTTFKFPPETTFVRAGVKPLP